MTNVHIIQIKTFENRILLRVHVCIGGSSCFMHVNCVICYVKSNKTNVKEVCCEFGVDHSK